MRNFRRQISIFGLVLLGAVSVAGCGDDAQDNDGSVRIDVIGWGPDMGGTLGFQAGLPEYLEAEDVRVSLRQPIEAKTLGSETFSVASRAGTVPSLENGEGYRLDFELLDAAGEPIAAGATPLFDMINGEENRRRLKIQVDPINDFSPVGAVINGSLTQSVLDYRGVRARGIERWLGRVGHQAVTFDRGNRALIVAGADAGDHPVRAGAEPVFVSLHDDVSEFDPLSGYFSDLAYDDEHETVFPNRGDRLRGARAFHTVTAIGEDKFLVIGGLGASGVSTKAIDSIELIDMKAEPGSRVQGLGGGLGLNTPRAFHTATYRPESNSVVVIGGIGEGGPNDVLDSVEIIDLDAMTVTDGPALSEARANHAAVLVDEDVWILGGRGASSALKSTEMLTASDSLEESFPMDVARYDFAAVPLTPLKGRGVMVVGGYTDLEGAVADTFEIGSIGHNQFFGPRGGFAMSVGRGNPHAIELPNSNDVVVLGGRDGSRARVTKAEIIQLNSLSDLQNPYKSVETGTSSHNKRADGSATLLSNGKILLTGGFGGEGVTTDKAEYFTPLDPAEP